MAAPASKMLQVVRGVFATWLSIELLSWAGVLPLTLEFTWLGLVLTASVAWAGVEIISWRLRKSGARNLWAGTFFLVLLSQCTDAFGDILLLYGTYSWYDQVAHVVGGMALGLVFAVTFIAAQAAGVARFGKKSLGALAVACAMALGSLYELEEYLEDVLTGSNRLGTGMDTGNDMLMNTIGAIAVVLVVQLVAHRRTRT